MSYFSPQKVKQHKRRKFKNHVALALSLMAMLFGLFWLAWILFETIYLGIGGINLAVFSEMTPPPNAEIGGLANAIWGSFLMVLMATLIGTPIGIMTGVYLCEYGGKGIIASVTRFINDIL